MCDKCCNCKKSKSAVAEVAENILMGYAVIFGGLYLWAAYSFGFFPF